MQNLAHLGSCVRFCLLISLIWIFLPVKSWALTRVIIAPFPGNAKYPLVIGGLRQVLHSDLNQSGQFKIIDEGYSASDLSSTNLSSLSLSADIVLFSTFRERIGDFTLSLRVNDAQTGYSLGSRDITGTYKNIKLVQDRLLSSALELLRTSIPEQQRTDLQKHHTAVVSAVQAVGQADVAVQKRDYVGAVKNFAKAKSFDRKFGTAEFQLTHQAPNLLKKIKKPEELGEAYLYLGNSQRSLSEYNQALKTDPQNISALVGKGRLLIQEGKASQAIVLLKRATQIDPKNDQAFAALGTAYQKIGQRSNALKMFEKARALGTVSAEVYEGLGKIYQAKGRKKAALESYQTAGELAQRAINYQQAQRYYGKVNSISPSAFSLLKQAQAYLDHGEVLLAITTLTKAIFLDSRNDSLHAKLGYAYYLDGRLGFALKHLEKAFELNPNNFEANFYLGAIHSQNPKMASNAIKHFENALRIRPGHHESRYRLAKLYLKTNQLTAAVTLLESFTSLNPQNARAHKELADVYFLTGSFDKAEVHYKLAIDLQSDFQEALEGLARIYIKQGNRSKALAIIEKIYVVNPSNNIFLREGTEVLGNLTAEKFIDLSLRFPKSVFSQFGDVPINQVGLVQLLRPKTWVEKLKEALQIYRINMDRIQEDLEVALFAQYRVIPQDKLGPLSDGKLDRAEFDSPAIMSEVLKPLRIDGLFGFEAIEFKAGSNSDQVKVDLHLFTQADKGLHSIEDKAMIPIAIYPKKQILKFNPLAFAIYGTLLAIVLLPFSYVTIYRVRSRGWGNVRVIVNYDPKLESFLTLKLSTKQEKERDQRLIIIRDKKKHEKRKYKQLLKQKGAWVREMVGRVTVFEKVPVRNYFCYLYGTIEDTVLTKSTIGNYYMVQKVTVEKEQTKEIVFQLEKEEAFVTIFVRKGENYVSGAEIIVKGDPTAKYSRGEKGTFVYLKKGKHKVKVTFEGQTVERELDIQNLDDLAMEIDVQTVEEAQEAAMGEVSLAHSAEDFESQGRLDDAAKLYEKAGKQERASQARAQSLLAEGNSEQAAEEYARGKDFIKAAELYRDSGEEAKAQVMYGYHHFQEGAYEKAAQYFENTEAFNALAKVYLKLGEQAKAHQAMGKDYLSKGQKLEAAQSFIKGEDYVSAAELYEGFKDYMKAAVLYVKDGNYGLAGELFAQAGDQKRAALAFEKGGMYEQALPIYEELGSTEKVIELLEQSDQPIKAALTCQKQGALDQAISICQKISDTHHEYGASQLLLGKFFSEKGMDDLAIETFRQVQQNHSQDFDPEASYTFASLLEKKGEHAQALEIFEELLKKDFHYKDVSIRIKNLKSKPPPAAMAETVAGESPKKETRYEILEELGRGAMGIVYKARDSMLDRIVAFKTLPHTLKNDPEALKSLMQEAKTAAKLNHANIVTVFDVGQENETYFIAMEYVEGKTLQEILKQFKKVSLENFAHIAKPLCEVIAYAHDQKVIHRDIKPSNILLLPTRTVKLMDFGLAKVLREISIDKTMLRGTPLYMSPEQILGKDIDHRTDIYSLGVLFYEMLAGKTPFYEGDIMYAHLHTSPPHLSELITDVPQQVISSIMSCLAKDKKQRPSSAKELLEQLQV